MAGLGVVVLVVALGALAAMLVRDPDSLPRRPRGPSARRRRRSRAALPGWIRETPVGSAEAERRSLELLRSVVNPDEWEMFQDLGFICVTGRRARRRPSEGARGAGAPVLPRYRYLVYPHLPVVALLPRSMAPVREYCVQFPDHSAGGQSPMLPRGDDVLAKWMTLRADEDRLLAYANVCNAGCQIPLGQIERDLERLGRWEARRARRTGSGGLAGAATAPLRGGGRLPT